MNEDGGFKSIDNEDNNDINEDGGDKPFEEKKIERSLDTEDLSLFDSTIEENEDGGYKSIERQKREWRCGYKIIEENPIIKEEPKKIIALPNKMPFDLKIFQSLKYFANAISKITKNPGINIAKFAKHSNEQHNFDKLGKDILERDTIKPKRSDSMSFISNLVNNIVKVVDDVTIFLKIFNKNNNSFHECIQ